MCMMAGTSEAHQQSLLKPQTGEIVQTPDSKDVEMTDFDVQASPGERVLPKAPGGAKWANEVPGVARMRF